MEAGLGTDKPSLFEQHAQTILTATVLALLLGSGGVLLALREDVSVLKSQVNFMNNQIQQGVDDRFRGADWRREKERLDERHRQIELRMDKIEEAHQGGFHRMLPNAK